MRAAACATLLAIAAGLPHAGGRPAVPRVTVHAWVENERGLPASDLQLEEFEVLVDRAAVPLEAVVPRRAMSVVVLLDTSRTVPWSTQTLPRHLGQFAAALPPDDRLMLATVGGRSTALPFQPAKHDLQSAIRQALNHEEGYGNTPIWDALHDAVTLLAREPPPRAVLLLTDGRATGNRYGLAESADHAMANDVSVTVVAKHIGRQILQGEKTAVLVQPWAPLEAVTRYTGGQFFTYPERQEEAAVTLFQGAAASLRGLHAFGFTPVQRNGAAHRLEIRSKRPGRIVHAPLAFVAR
ncbi:MAG TPA: VWA domain-containing protein [Vicinamibacterales bacterium]|nr:VWA domain-containing protein [Vicinamibacterales bacterium]